MNIWLGIIKTSNSYTDGYLKLGIYSGKNYEEAKNNLIQQLSKREQETAEFDVVGINQSPIIAADIPTTYRDNYDY